MGLFFLDKRDSPALSEGWWRPFTDVGFGRMVSLNAGDWTVRLFGKLNGSGPHLIRKGQDFAACTGTFFYRGKRLEAGLDILLDEFDEVSFPWSESRGHYAVVLFKAGRLWLASDEMGAYKIYRNADSTRFSSSFSALRATLSAAVPDDQGIYEYAFNGATFGEKTFLRDIKQQREGCLYCFRVSGTPKVITPSTRSATAGYRSLDESVDDFVERLRALFRVYGDGSGGFRTALSGGYDSRLILALLLDMGARPELFVYGEPNEPDVRVAKEISEGEGLRLRHLHKDALASQASFCLTRAWTLFDSWKVGGLFGSGVDEQDRIDRAHGGFDVLNGSGGEVFRNFFYMRNRPFTPEEIVWSFYCRFDPGEVTHRFHRSEYIAALAEDIRLSLPNNPRSRSLSREQIESLYPRFRVRYWTGRDVGLNQRFGPLLFPFLEPAIFTGSERVPMVHKDCGQFEARILQRISPKLAEYRSAYGFPLSSRPPLSYRLKVGLTLCRPPFLRQFSYRIQSKMRGRAVAPRWFEEALKAAKLDPSLPVMRDFFKVDQISDFEMLNRVATVELILQHSALQLSRPVGRDVFEHAA